MNANDLGASPNGIAEICKTAAIYFLLASRTAQTERSICVPSNVKRKRNDADATRPAIIVPSKRVGAA
jgi:hypothetical protein